MARPMMPIRVLLAVVIELAYAVGTRTWLRAHVEGVERELLVSVCRLATLAVYWVLFKEVILSRPPSEAPRRTPLLVLGVLPLFLVPLLFDGGMPGDATTRAVFAITSMIVAVREEVLYRGVLQNLLERRCGRLAALLLSNVVFTLYHYGAQPFTAFGLVELFSMGCVFGLIYGKNGSLMIPIVLHAAYDAAWSLGPLITTPLGDGWRIPFFLSGLGLVAAWGWPRTRWDARRTGVPAARRD